MTALGRTMADYYLHEICALKGKCITVFDVRFNPFSLEAIFLSLKCIQFSEMIITDFFMH